MGAQKRSLGRKTFTGTVNMFLHWLYDIEKRFSLSHDFISICVCRSCSGVITHDSGNEAYGKDAAQNAATGEKKKKKEDVFSGMN